MSRQINADSRPLQLTPAALDAGAAIQDAVVRRLRFVRAATADSPRPRQVEDRPALMALLGRRR